MSQGVPCDPSREAQYQREIAVSIKADESKPEPSDTVRREIDRIARQLDGLTNRLKRVKDAL